MNEKQKEIFSQERWNELCSLVKEKGMDISYKDFTVSELKYIFDETKMKDLERKGAEMFYIRKMSKTQIANELFVDLSTIKYHHKKVIALLKETCLKLFK